MSSRIASKDAAGGRRVAESPLEAFRDVVYARGVEDVANNIGMKKGTLYNKCDADVESHHQPTLRDVMLVTAFTGDHRVLDSLDRMFMRAAYDITPGLPTDDASIVELLCKIGSEKGQMLQVLREGMKDGRFCPADKAAFRAEVHDVLTAVLELQQRVESIDD